MLGPKGTFQIIRVTLKVTLMILYISHKNIFMILICKYWTIKRTNIAD